MLQSSVAWALRSCLQHMPASLQLLCLVIVCGDQEDAQTASKGHEQSRISNQNAVNANWCLKHATGTL